jgi:hypothetical protein
MTYSLHNELLCTWSTAGRILRCSSSSNAYFIVQFWLLQKALNRNASSVNSFCPKPLCGIVYCVKDQSQLLVKK